MSGGKAWSTADELAYIRRIGQGSEQTRNASRHALLKNYFHAGQQRANWGTMDRTAVLKAAFQAMLAAREEEGA